jgi:hypothetical protein
MRSEVLALTRNDNAECGSYLFGPVPRSWEREVQIFHATTTGENAVRRSGSMTLDSSRMRDAERWIKANGWSDALVGFWHSHDREVGRNAGLPSAHDLRYFLLTRDWCNETHGGAFSVGLIINAGRPSSAFGSEHSWATPNLRAWVTRRTSAGTAVTEEAEVVGWR